MDTRVGLTDAEITPPPLFDPRNVQPEASRYTDHAIPVLKVAKESIKIYFLVIQKGGRSS